MTDSSPTFNHKAFLPTLTEGPGVYRMLNADGEVFPAEVSLSPMPLLGDTVVFALVRDLTEQKRSEQELREAREAAEHILGMDIKGSTVRKVLVEQGADIQKEAYLGLIIDRADEDDLRSGLQHTVRGRVDLDTLL